MPSKESASLPKRARLRTLKCSIRPIRVLFIAVCILATLWLMYRLPTNYFCSKVDQEVITLDDGGSAHHNEHIVAPLSVDGIYDLTSRLPGFRETVSDNCTSLVFARDAREDTDYVKRVRAWRFNDEDFYKQYFLKARDKCGNLRNTLLFPSQPLSDEERDYPLAYGMLVYSSIVQVYFLLSAIYQPQNAYCIAIDGKASQSFVDGVEMLGDCLPNVFVMRVSEVKWCEFSVVRGVFGCLRYLSNMDHDWKYYQYLSGVDLPLKTNLEMVRIFKQMNNTVNVEVTPQQQHRLTQLKGKPQPLPLWKSSLSSLLPRPTVNGIFASYGKLSELMQYLSQASCADESLWTTLSGNTKDLPIPGSFDASAFYKALKDAEANSSKVTRSLHSIVNAATYEEPFMLSRYYVSRYQIWVSSPSTCNGRMVHGSCAYGVKDFGELLFRPELVAHKFYFTIEPAAYFCVYEAVRQRAYHADGQKRFVGSAYAQLPHVRIAAGERSDRVKYFFN